jgi:hypothetical protein
VTAGFSFYNKKDLLWVLAATLLVVSLIILPGLSKLAADCNKRKESDEFDNVVYVRSPGK